MRIGRTSLVVLAMILATSASALDSSGWPTTVDVATHDIVSQLSHSEKLHIKQMTQSELVLLHFSLGLKIRNQFGLWSGNEKLLMSACGKPCSPDDASAIIIEAVWRDIRK